MSNLFFAVWLFMVADIICYLILCMVIFSRLKSAHRATWEQLGSPSLFFNNSIRNNFLYLNFLLHRDYRRLNDQALTQIANATLILFCVASVIFPLIVLGVFKAS